MFSTPRFRPLIRTGGRRDGRLSPMEQAASSSSEKVTPKCREGFFCCLPSYLLRPLLSQGGIDLFFSRTFFFSLGGILVCLVATSWYLAGNEHFLLDGNGIQSPPGIRVKQHPNPISPSSGGKRRVGERERERRIGCLASKPTDTWLNLRGQTEGSLLFKETGGAQFFM